MNEKKVALEIENGSDFYEQSKVCQHSSNAFYFPKHFSKLQLILTHLYKVTYKVMLPG